MQRELTAQEEAVRAALAARLRLEPVAGVVSAGLTRGTERYTMPDARVFRVPGTDTVFVFGSLGYGYDLRALREQVARLRQAAAAPPAPDEDVDLVAQQAGVSRERAARALAESGNDVLAALQALAE